jgi:hypothetical protein
VYKFYQEFKNKKKGGNQEGGAVSAVNPDGSVRSNDLMHALAVNLSLQQSPKLEFVKKADLMLKQVLSDPSLTPDELVIWNRIPELIKINVQVACKSMYSKDACESNSTPLISLLSVSRRFYNRMGTGHVSMFDVEVENTEMIKIKIQIKKKAQLSLPMNFKKIVNG